MAILRPSNPNTTTVVASPSKEPKAVLHKSIGKTGDEATGWWNNLALLRGALVIMLVVAFNANLYFFSMFEKYEDSIKVEQMAIDMELRGNELHKFVGESETKWRSHVQALEDKIEGLVQKKVRTTQTHKIYLDLGKPDQGPLELNLSEPNRDPLKRRLKGSRVVHLESPI